MGDIVMDQFLQMSIVSMILGAICCVIATMGNAGDVPSFWKIYLKRISPVLIMFALIFAFLSAILYVKHDKYQEFCRAVDDGYVIYLDGEEVDPECLNLESYYSSAEIDEENHTVLISK